MKIPAGIVGTSLAPRRCEVSWRMTTNFAAGVGDANPRYLDDSGPGGLQVHPVFPVALSWPVIASLGEQLAGLLPEDAILRMVHACESIAWHRPLVPGDTLQLAGQIASVAATAAGALVVLRVEAHREDGEHVYTEDIGGLFRGVAIDGPDAGAPVESPPPVPASEPQWRESLAVPGQASFVYDGCSQIVFPIHTSASFARGVGLPGIILQGTCALAMAVSRLVRREAGDDPSRVREISCRFRRPVLPGTTVSLEGLGRESQAGSVLIGFRLLNADGEAALDHGRLKLACDERATP